MSSPPERRNPWALSGEAFERLLAAFAPSREEAALRYESLRQRLVRYFTWERCPFPEERADEALNRVARRLEEGEPVQNVEQYAAGDTRRRPALPRRFAADFAALPLSLIHI